ncbi:hypothetical protein N657DRAFT_642875 [Parathielavia appendiculata]|uniref:rRNA-processing protein FYV7 n=1 Tax=Parathielavia appendiculata TaxID=2587402 RepID=A0AAN6U4Q2_9PEZI|nr:hypothetical protein N657DRAFT_642875 [Parathielavia appendiculata]
MPSKRPRDEDASPDPGASPAPVDARKAKKAKHGFRVGPENLPDGPWRRKVTKIKKELIIKAKVKKQYAKIKAELQQQAAPTITSNEHQHEANAHSDPQNDGQTASNSQQIHPERQAMLDSSPELNAKPNPTPNTNPSFPNRPEQLGQSQQLAQRRPRKPRRPDYYTKELAAAERAKKEAEERAAEFASRERERQQRITERERYRKAMAKAKAPGKDGKPKVGRESKILLERVKKIMGRV